MSRVINAIVAVCPGMGIGKDGKLPWPLLRNEFKYFQRMTMTPKVEGKQNAVIMGRKTWLSIPEKNRPLKGRINIVLSRELTKSASALDSVGCCHPHVRIIAVLSSENTSYREPPQGAHHLAKSLDDALALLETPELSSKVDQVWIIGGSSLYKELMEKPVHQRLFVTRILQEFECDTFLPEINRDTYSLLPEYPGISADLQEENGVQYRFEVFEKTI
ncbi:dihydrofolate reductase isoform X1 [Microcaecilia unicolor]|uniref:Dihydrofolate reductase n=1 Tax=Microcaecilia unicolor TaxID=1415580 RepID=A0A6P7XDB3_9AMPH|nr:dihydrofolate reductase isoform X1 [Microcaecilia unicolor]